MVNGKLKFDNWLIMLSIMMKNSFNIIFSRIGRLLDILLSKIYFPTFKFYEEKWNEFHCFSHRKRLNKPLWFVLGLSLTLSSSISISATEYSMQKSSISHESVVDIDDFSNDFDNQITPSEEIRIIKFIGNRCVVDIPDSVRDNKGTYPVTEIASYAFSNRKDVYEILVPKTVKSIGEGAFSYCEKLVYVSILADLDSIQDRTFYSCSDLSDFKIPRTVKHIGHSAFAYCGMDTIRIPASVTSLGIPDRYNGTSPTYLFSDSVFVTPGHGFDSYKISKVRKLKDYVSKDGILYSRKMDTLVKCSPEKIGKVHIPNTVKCIDEYAFLKCEEITEVDIPESVDSIGKYAFYGCEKLSSVPSLGNARSIGEGTFEKCVLLEKLVIPASVRQIKDRPFSFYNSGLKSLSILNPQISVNGYYDLPCENLSNLTLSASLLLKKEFLEKCANKKSIHLIDSDPNYKLHEGLVYSKNMDTLYYCDRGKKGKVVMPNSVRHIGNWAFAYCDSLIEIVIPESVVSIDDHAFENCKNLTSLIIPNSVKKVGWRFLDGCKKLSSVNIPADCNFEKFPLSYRLQNKLNVMIDSCIYSGDTTTLIQYKHNGGKVTFPKSLKIIEPRSFHASTLDSLFIPEGVTRIEPFTFFGGKYVHLPNSLRYIGPHVFSSNLRHINIPLSVDTIETEFYVGDNGYSTSFKGKTNSTGVGFSDSTNLGLVIYSNGTKCLGWVGDHKQCKQVRLPKTVTYINSGAFLLCEDLCKIKIPKHVNFIGKEAFCGTNLKRVEIPQNVIVINDRSFFCCINLREVELPKNLKTIGEEAFYDCRNLQSIDIPSSVEFIGKEAFSLCLGLKTLRLPDSLKKMGSEAFAYCFDLESVTMPDSYHSDTLDAFVGCRNLKEIKVGKNNKYYVFMDGILYNKDMTKLCLCTGGKSGNIVVPEGVKEIAPAAFSGCTKISSITLPTTITSISRSPFGNCYNFVLRLPASKKDMVLPELENVEVEYYE